MLQMLSRQELSWIHHPLLEGYMTSAGAGSGTVLQASRNALVAFAEHVSRSPEPTTHSLRDLFWHITTILSNSLELGRIAIPTMEVLAFMIDVGLGTQVDFEPEKYASLIRVSASRLTRNRWAQLLDTINRSRAKSRNVAKIETAVKLYSSLAWQPSIRLEALKNLAAMLLHPFSKVRGLMHE